MFYFKILIFLVIYLPACHAELVEAWWAGLYARSFDKLRMTGLV